MWSGRRKDTMGGKRVDPAEMGQLAPTEAASQFQ